MVTEKMMGRGGQDRRVSICSDGVFRVGFSEEVTFKRGPEVGCEIDGGESCPVPMPFLQPLPLLLQASSLRSGAGRMCCTGCAGLSRSTLCSAPGSMASR